MFLCDCPAMFNQILACSLQLQNLTDLSVLLDANDWLVCFTIILSSPNLTTAEAAEAAGGHVA